MTKAFRITRLRLPAHTPRNQDNGLGFVKNLEPSAFSDTLEHAQVELREAMELQLNEVERLGYAREYLDKNQVPVASIPTNRQRGFTLATAGRLEHNRA